MDWNNHQGSGARDLINSYKGRNSPKVNMITVFTLEYYKIELLSICYSILTVCL